MRVSKIPCTARCVHSPFSIDTYDAFRRVDRSLSVKAMQYLSKHVTRHEFMAMASRLWPLKAEGGKSNDVVAQDLASYALFFVQKDPAGRTLAERWEAENWRGLTNDERVIFCARREAYPTVIEVQRVLDDQAIECTDTLAPGSEPFVVFDRRTAARAVRFDQYLVWLSRFPHYHRIGSAGLLVSRHVAQELERELRSRARVGYGPEDTLALRHYLKSHFGECAKLLVELSVASRRRIIDAMDLHHCVARYRLAAEREEVQRILDGKVDFVSDRQAPDKDDPPGTTSYVWLRRGESEAFEQQHIATGFEFDAFYEGVGTIGSVKLLPDVLVIETFTRAKYDFAKQLIERYFGQRLVLIRESFANLAAEAAKPAATAPDTQGAPAEREIPLEVEQILVQRAYTEHYRRMLDKPIPALDGLTSRQAAANPAARPKLIELLKLHVHQMEKMAVERGVYVDLDWVLEELGIDELRDDR